MRIVTRGLPMVVVTVLVAAGLVVLTTSPGASAATAPASDLYTWGYNAYFELGDGTNITRADRGDPVPLPDGERIAVAAGGGGHSLAAVTVSWSTLFGPGVEPPYPAEQGIDFEAASGTVAFSPGQTEATVPITVYGDTMAEDDEFVVVSFHDATNANIGGFWGLGIGVIGSDDNE